MNEDVFTRQKRPPCSTQSDEIELDTQNIVEPKATDFLKSPKVKVIRFISVAVFAVLSIACIVIGCLNLNNCPLEPKLPLLLILFGIWGLASCVYSGFFEHLPWKWLQLGSFYILYLMIFAWVGTSGSIIVLTGMTSQSLNFSANQTCSLDQSWNNVSSANESNISTGGGDKMTPKIPNPPYCDPVTHATVTGIVLVMDIGYLFFIAALGIYKWKDKQIMKTSSVIRNMWSSHKKLQSFGPAFLLLLNAVFAVQSIFPSYILSKNCCTNLTSELSLSLFTFAILPAISIALLSLALFLYYFHNQFSAVYPGILMLVYMVPWCVLEFYLSGVFFTKYTIPPYPSMDTVIRHYCGIAPYNAMFLIHLSFYIFQLPFVILASCGSLWLLWKYQKNNFNY